MRMGKTAENAVWLMAGRLGQMGISLVAGILTTRYLGPEDYGLIQYAAAYTGFFASLAALGIPSVLVKELSDDPSREGEILGTALALRLAAGMLAAGCVSLLLLAAERGNRLLLAAALLSCGNLVLQMLEVFRQWLQFRMLSKITAAVSLGACLLGAGYRLGLVLLGGDVLWFAAAGMLETAATGLGLLLCYRRLGGGRLGISREKAGSILKKSIHFLLPGLMVSVYAQTDKLMLGWMLGEAETGYYAAAVSVCNSWCFVPAAIIEAVQPELTRLHKTDKMGFLRGNRLLYAGIFWLSTGVSVIFWCFGEWVVQALYGAAFLPAAKALGILTWQTGLSYLGVARNVWTVCENRQKYLVWVYGAAAVSNVAMNALLIPVWGMTGAAVASLAAQAVTVLVVPFCVGPLQENGKLMWSGILLRKIR